MDTLGATLGSVPLLAASPMERTFYVATSTVEFKLVSTADGGTLWYGTGTGTANRKDGLNKTVDASLKAGFSSLINDLSAAQLNTR